MIQCYQLGAHFLPVCPGFEFWVQHHTWAEFVVGSRSFSEGFVFASFSCFSPSTNTKSLSLKFQLYSKTEYINITTPGMYMCMSFNSKLFIFSYSLPKQHDLVTPCTLTSE